MLLLLLSSSYYHVNIRNHLRVEHQTRTLLMFLGCGSPIKRCKAREPSLISFGRQPNTTRTFFNRFILNLGMHISAIFLIFCVFHIRSARSGLITEKLKLSKDSEVCPPGLWTCSTEKRSEIDKMEKSSRTVKRPATKPYPYFDIRGK